MSGLARRDGLVAPRAEAHRAVFEYGGALGWLAPVGDDFNEPIGVEVWTLDSALAEVLLVLHRWRGWVPPGGAVEPGELPPVAAERELAEETGLHVPLLARPAAVAVRSYHPDWPSTLGISYAAILDADATEVIGERDQPLEWMPLAQHWESGFQDDRHRIIDFVGWLQQEG